MSTMQSITRQIMEERARQIMEEGFTHERDDKHTRSEMARAAAALAVSFVKPDLAEKVWPTTWRVCWLRSPDYRRALIKAGALLVAEIERIDRAKEAGQ